MVATIYDTPDAALEGIEDGVRIMFGGFSGAGCPSNLIRALRRRGTRDITGIANNIGFGDMLVELCEDRQLRGMICTFATRASAALRSRFDEQYERGEVELELTPQGTFSERIRAGGGGLGGVLTRSGLGTPVAEGKTTIEVDGETFLLERPLHAHVAMIRAQRADRLGNLEYRGAARNFNPLMATAADLVIAEVEEIVEVGVIDPERVGTPAIFVDRIVQCPRLQAPPR